MGCDIHLYTEINRGKGWENCDYFCLSNPLDESPKLRMIELYGYRNYDLFAVLADVRNYNNLGYIDRPRGIPEDATEYVKKQYDTWYDDAHSGSYFTLKELIDYHEEHKPKHNYGGYILEPLIDRLKQRADDLYFIYNFEWDGSRKEEALKQAKNIRIVFWFDN